MMKCWTRLADGSFRPDPNAEFRTPKRAQWCVLWFVRPTSAAKSALRSGPNRRCGLVRPAHGRCRAGALCKPSSTQKATCAQWEAQASGHTGSFSGYGTRDPPMTLLPGKYSDHGKGSYAQLRETLIKRL